MRGTCRRAAGLIAGVVIAGGVANLAGWPLGATVLISLVRGATATNPLTAAAFIVLGASLLLQLHPQAGWRRRLARALALVVSLVAVTRLSGYVLGAPLPIDELIYPSRVRAAGNCMAPNTAIGLWLAATVLLVLDERPRHSQLGALAMVALALTAVIGYAFGMATLYEVGAFIPMAPLTALLFALLGLALLAARPERGLARSLTSTTAGGVMARRLLPLAVAVPIALEWLRLYSQRLAPGPRAIAAPLVVVCHAAFFVSLIWWNARWLAAIDRRRRTANRIRRAGQERYRAVVEETSEGIFLAHADTLVIFEANRALLRLTGHRPEELGTLDARAFGDDACVPGERRYRCADGRVIDVEVAASVIHETGGDTLSVLLHDIGERKEIERLKDEFVSTVSHELRTPVAAIRGALGLIEGGVAGELDGEARELVRIARANSDRLTRLIDDILDLEKIAAGKLELALTPHDPRALVAATLETLQTLARDRDVVTVADVDTRRSVCCDGDRIVQVLVNLIANALKFSPRGGRVTVRARDNGGAVRFAVADEGPGIAPHQLGKLFQRFSQVDGSDSRPQGGSGLGLAICRAIVERHGGTIGVESTLGAGSTFWFALPACAPAAAHTAEARQTT